MAARVKSGKCILLCGSLTRPCLLFPQHYDKACGKPGRGGVDPGEGGDGAAKKTQDISQLLAQEVADLKDRSQHRFKVHNVDVKGCTFIVFPVETQGGEGGVGYA